MNKLNNASVKIYNDIINWKIGSIAIQNRPQSHSASDFTKSMVYKTAITIFV